MCTAALRGMWRRRHATRTRVHAGASAPRAAAGLYARACRVHHRRGVKLIVLLVLLAGGCAGTFGGPSSARVCDRLCHLNRIGRGAAVLTLAADAASTYAAADREWKMVGSPATGVEEGGFPTRAILGGAPSTGAVAAYFVIGTAVLMGAAELLPDRLKPFVYGAVIAVEGYTVYGNIETAGVVGLETGRVR